MMDIMNKKLKLSELTYIYPNYDGEDRNLIVTNITGASVIIDDNFRNILEIFESPQIPSTLLGNDYAEVIQKMYEVKMLIEPEDDGYALFKERVDECKTMSPLEIVVAVTTQCNMACPYCFEKSSNEYIDSELVQRLLQYTTERMDHENIKNINTTLYGGEPLINQKICREWLEKIAKEVEKRQGSLKVGIITNGTLIDEDFMQFYSQYNRPAMQITIDGSRDIHNQRRILKSGKGSYDNLLDKLPMIISHDVVLNIRINIDKENFNCIPELIEDLKARNINQPNVNVSLERVVGDTACGTTYIDKCFTSTEYDLSIIPLVQMFNQAGFQTTFKEKNTLRPIYCRAYSDKHLVVAPSGKLYTCLSGVGKDEYVVGNLYDTPVFNERFREWKEFSVLNFAKCKQCPVIGFCGGGCAAEAFSRYGSLSQEPVCPPLKTSYVGGVILPAEVRKKFLDI